MSVEVIQKFKCVNNHVWESKDTGICPECYTNLYELKGVMDMKQDDEFYYNVLGTINQLKKKYNLTKFGIVEAINEEL